MQWILLLRVVWLEYGPGSANARKAESVPHLRISAEKLGYMLITANFENIVWSQVFGWQYGKADCPSKGTREHSGIMSGCAEMQLSHTHIVFQLQCFSRLTGEINWGVWSIHYMYQSGRKLQGYPNAQKEREEKGGYARIYCWTFRSHITGLTNKQRAVFQA